MSPHTKNVFKKKIWAMAGILMVLGAINGGIGGAKSASAATASSLTMTITGNPTINLPPSAEGKFADSGKESITISTTHAAGYTLTVKASDATTLKNTSGTVGFTSISSAISAETFDSSDYNGYWGYRPSKLNSTSNTNYLPSPSTTGDTLDTTSDSANNTYTVSIGARANMDTAIDSYKNTFVFTVTANPTPYAISYNANTTDTVSGMPSNVDSTTSGDVTLSTAEPTREGYAFQGWCTNAVADGVSCTGASYAAGATFSIDQTRAKASNTLVLYAVWEEDSSALYDLVAAMSKGTQTAADLQASITTSNSGVYEYNSSVFGTASDASNDNKIYYYRGILDNTTGSYGSDGDAGAYPNYVILDANGTKDTSDTCWRIVRTTGSGGVKMIYNGKWTGSTCANATTNAQVTTSAYNGTSSTYRQIVRVGYTYNSTYAANSASTAAISTVLGSDSNYSVNNTDSTIKDYIEDTWYSNISGYESILEPSAGYCNDRTVYNSSNVLQGESTNIVTYGTSGMTVYYFGARVRNYTTAQVPSLTCPRDVVDLYTTSGASDGNKQLSKPVALLTADEMSFAGSGSSTATNGSGYHANSYLRSGSNFWLLSPHYRSSGGVAVVFGLRSNGLLVYGDVSSTYGVRPAISLASGTAASSGSGTATDPWVVVAP